MADQDVVAGGADVSGERARTEYLKLHELYVELEQDAARSFDKYLITLSAGALGLSLSFIRQIAPDPAFEYLLVLAWTFLGAALLMMLFSFLMSQEGIRRYRDIMEAREEARQSGSAPPTNECNIWPAITRCLNYGAIIVFVVGVGFLAAFSAKNLSRADEKVASVNYEQHAARGDERAALNGSANAPPVVAFDG